MTFMHHSLTDAELLRAADLMSSHHVRIIADRLRARRLQIMAAGVHLDLLQRALELGDTGTASVHVGKALAALQDDI